MLMISCWPFMFISLNKLFIISAIISNKWHQSQMLASEGWFCFQGFYWPVNGDIIFCSFFMYSYEGIGSI